MKELMTKKHLIIVPLVLTFSACSNTQNLSLDTPTSNKTTLSYNEFLKLQEAKNKIIKTNNSTKFDSIFSQKEYKSLATNNSNKIENSSITKSEIPKRKQAFMDFYSEWKNVRYKLGGETKKGIDCSAFTQRIYKDKFGIELPRTTLTQVNIGTEVKKSELIPGDLVFFKTSKTDKHVGVYVGNGNFMHASIKGIQFTSLDKPFYKKNYWTSRRIID